MPYDPRMLQMAQMGVGMLGPFGNDTRNQPQRPPQWWEQPLPAQQRRPDDPGTPSDGANSPEQGGAKKPPSLLDMMMGLGRMSRPQYDRAIQGQGGYGISPKDAAQVSPWAFLGSLGGGAPG
jgi:hypothetical protein